MPTPPSTCDPVKLYRVLTGLRHVKRFQRDGCVRPISVAEHSYNAALLAGCYAHQLATRDVPVDRAMVLEAALWHDAAEAITGDIPHDFKRAAGRVLYESWDHAEHTMLRRIGALNSGLPAVLTAPDAHPVEALVVKLADWVELVLYVAEEQRLGNRTLNIASRRIWTLLNDRLRTKASTLLPGFAGSRLHDWYHDTLRLLAAQAPPPAEAEAFYPDEVMTWEARL